MTKMNDREPKERKGTSRLNDVLLKIYPQNFSNCKFCKADFSQTKKMRNKNSSKTYRTIYDDIFTVDL